jgi:7-carboxy-7-deazaguanine synthase
MAGNKCLEVSEIFYSIQGESTFSGLPCVFIRLSGCNLQCSYCDSRYAVEEHGRIMTLDEILARVSSFPGTMVEVTGGEPLLQNGVHALIDRLLAGGKKVLIETNGSLSIATLPIEVTVIMDIKCPGSGSTSLHPDNIDICRKRTALRSDATEIKFVVSSLEDYEWAKEMIMQCDLLSFAPVLFSPVRDRLPVRKLAEAILKDALPVRLQMQLHTIIWPDVPRGV